MEPTQALITWPDPIVELVGFLASFLAVGAVGFRLFVLRGALRAAGAGEEEVVLTKAARRAALLGLVGIVVTVGLFAMDLPSQAADRHTTVAHLLASNAQTQVEAALLLAALLGFVLALARVGFGWGLAALGVIGSPLSGLFFGPLVRLVNPLHRLAGGMWIGTLFMLVAAGIATLLKSTLPAERRAALAFALVRAFSPLALTSAAFLALFGVITAWRHLHVLSALWTTPYGITLIIKLGAVGAVLALGAWNWRRQKPRLGTEAGAHGLRKSATGELVAAGIVLVITAVLVSLPSPRPPGAAGPGGPPPASGAPPAP